MKGLRTLCDEAIQLWDADCDMDGVINEMRAAPQVRRNSMTEQHPITPPPDKIHNWLQLEKVDYTLGQIITLAAQWGADQELESCVQWISEQDWTWTSAQLRAARRPKTQTLNSIALQMLGTIEQMGVVIPEITDTIRHALEALPDD